LGTKRPGGELKKPGWNCETSS